VTISVVCPYCETEYQVNPDLAGKSMRCPNASCREIIEVPAAVVPLPAPTIPTAPRVFDAESVFELPAPPAELPFERIEADSVGPLEAIVADDEPPSVFELPIDEPPIRSAILLPKPSEKIPPAAVSIPKATLLPPVQKAKKVGGPKEVAWTDNAPLPGAPATPAAVATDDDEPFRPRRGKKRSWPMVLLIVLSLATFVGLGFIGYGLLQQSKLKEDQLAADAETAYKDGNYPTAQKRYEELLEKFPDSDAKSRYRFFARLSETSAVIGSVTSRDNPDAGQKAFDRFVAEFKDDPLAQPETGFGTDIVQAGKRLADTLAEFAGDRLKDFRADRTKLEPLSTAEKTVADGRTLLPIVDRFRDKQGLNLDPQRAKFDELAKAFSAERHRLSVLEPYRSLANEPTAAGIEEFEQMLKENNLAADAEAKAMLALAEKNLRATIIFTAKPVAASRIPSAPHPPVLFAAAVAGVPQPRISLDAAPDIVFAVARGVLYALDAQTGTVVWGTRVGPPTLDPRAADVPVRITLGDGATDWVLVTDESTATPGLTARVARTGESVWYQPLPSPALARPVVIGGRVYLPLRDRLGTVIEFDALSGAKVGELTIRQPIGTGLVAIPGPSLGESYLVVPADAFRCFIFGIGSEDADGNKLPARCVRVFQTDHPRDSLRGEPIPVVPAEPTGPRLLVFTQADGPTTMKLRAFALPTAADLAASDTATVDRPTAPPAEVVVPGWAWFPPVSDGERLVLATDAGAFLAYGINQLQNADRPLFALPGPAARGEADAVLRSQIVLAEEDGYWAVIAGNLVRLRTSVNATVGYQILQSGGGRPVGEPVHRPQIRPGLGLGVVVARTGSAVQAIGFDIATGQLRWQQRLGLSGTHAPVGRADGSALIPDDDGGVYLVGTGANSGRTAADTLLAEPIARPLADLSGRAAVAAGDDGKSLWVLAPEAADREGRRLRVRWIVDRVVKLETSVPLPDALAGSPLIRGNSLLIPLANGYIHRFDPGDTQLTLGPLWRSDADKDAVCHLAAVGDEDFLATDGGRRFARWKWTAGAKPTKTTGAWEMKEKLVGPPVVFAGADSVRFVAADRSGALHLFAGDLPGDPLRRWRSGGPIPAGVPSNLGAIAIGDRRLLLYGVDRRAVVVLDPNLAEPVWVADGLVSANGGELTGWRLDGGRVIAPDQSGRVTMLDAETGKVFASVPKTLLGTVATAAAVPLTAGEALLPVADGTASTVALPPRPIVLPE